MSIKDSLDLENKLENTKILGNSTGRPITRNLNGEGLVTAIYI